MSINAANEAPQGQTLTAADRIRQLNDIDQDVTKLIRSAGLAIQALTNTKPDCAPADSDGSLESHETQFQDATAQYFALLSSIDVRLRRQVFALEGASLVAPESTSRTGDATGTSAGIGGGASGAAAAAANPLDVSWLNSRKDTVGKDKEAELWAAARQYVEQLNQNPDENKSSETQDSNPEEMQVD